MDVLCHFWLKLAKCIQNGEKVENLKSLQMKKRTDGRTDGRTDRQDGQTERRQTTDDQKSSLEVHLR